MARTPTVAADWKKLEFDIQALFTPAAPISEKDMFAGRAEQLDRLLSAVLEAGRHAVLFGERGVGKTSLANIFHKFFGDGQNQRLVSIRKQISPNDSYTSIWRKVFREITFETNVEGPYGKQTDQRTTIADSYPNDIVPDDVVRELSRVGSQAIFAVIFDEFDKLTDVDSKRLMSHTLKALSDLGVRATIILVGVADDINVLVAEHQSVTRNIAEIKMPRMSKDELKSIIFERYHKIGLKIEGDALWKIVTLARGLPEYVHALGRDAALAAVGENRTKVNEADVDSAIRKNLQQSDQSANAAYKAAIDSNKKNALYRQVLLACALAKTDDEGKFVAKDVVEPLSGIIGRKVEIANFQAHLSAFCDPDRGQILERLGKERAFKYRFREPKMQPFVLMQGIASREAGNEALAILSAPEQPKFSSEF